MKFGVRYNNDHSQASHFGCRICSFPALADDVRRVQAVGFVLHIFTDWRGL